MNNPTQNLTQNQLGNSELKQIEELAEETGIDV